VRQAYKDADIRLSRPTMVASKPPQNQSNQSPARQAVPVSELPYPPDDFDT